jgi:NADP-dependent alcohol dehydrogenase
VNKSDFLMAVGGGSVIDGTKFIAAAVNYTGDTWEILETHGTQITKLCLLRVYSLFRQLVQK